MDQSWAGQHSEPTPELSELITSMTNVAFRTLVRWRGASGDISAVRLYLRLDVQDVETGVPGSQRKVQFVVRACDSDDGTVWICSGEL